MSGWENKTFPKGRTDLGEIFYENVRGVAHGEGDGTRKGGGRTTGGSQSLLNGEAADVDEKAGS